MFDPFSLSLYLNQSIASTRERTRTKHVFTWGRTSKFQVSNFEVFRPKCEVILFGTAQREDVFNQQERKKYQTGVPLSNDLHNQVKELAQDYCFSQVGRRLRISKGAVSKIIKPYNLTGSTAPKKLNHVRTVPKWTFQDSILLETMVQATGSSSLKELRDDFAIHGDCG